MPGKILITDAIATNRISLRSRLSAAYYEVVQASCAEDALNMLATEAPDLVVIASCLPDMTASQMCARLRALPNHGDLPVIVLGCDTDRAQRLAVLQAGADDAFDRQVDPRLLLARLRSLLRNGTSREDRRLHSSACASAGFAEPVSGFIQQPRVAIVSEDSGRALTWMKRLQARRPYHFSLHSPRALSLDVGRAAPPDVILIVGGSGEEPDFAADLLAAFGAQPGFRRCKFLAVMPDSRCAPAVQMLDLGAHDLMFSPFDPDEAIHRLDQLLRRKARSDALHQTLQTGLRAALIDPLTGLHNRRYALPELTRLLEQGMQTGQDTAIMLADLDHFKRLNDTYGHSAGDAVLSEVSRRLRNVLRPGDLIARFGGEEFLIALPATPATDAHATAATLCRAISGSPVQLPDGSDRINVTISIGLAMGRAANSPAQGATDALLNMADQALYRAKAHGRNQVRPAA